MSPRLQRPRLTAALAAIAVATLLGGCAATDPEPADTSAAPAPTTSAPTPTETPIALAPDGAAEENLPFFTQIVEQVWASEQRAEGRAYIDALVEGGFDKAAMQVTEDLSTVGNPAESMQFSVLWNGECLVGQVGPDIGEAVTRVLPALQDGTACLVGATRPIDW